MDEAGRMEGAAPPRYLSCRLPGRAAACVLVAAGLLLPALLPLSASLQAAQSAEALMRRIDEMWRGESSHARITMKVATRRYTRSMTMEAWSQGKEMSLVVIRSPKKDRGIATLKAGDRIWNFLPKIDRVTKIPPSMMMGSWMGSHFTNDDLVKESSFEEDYDSTISFQGTREGRAVYEITSLPRPEAVVVWGKVVTVVEQESLLPLRARYFDEEGALAREMVFSEPRRFGKRVIPSRLVLTPADKPEESTTVIYEEIAFDVKLAGNLFSLRALRGGRGR